MVVKVSADGFEGWSRPADNNKEVILPHLRRLVADYAEVLEVGSGSGQHAVFFGASLPSIRWQPTDQGDYYDMLVSNLEGISLPNVYSPRYLDVGDFPNLGTFDVAYCANVFHIMSASLIEPMFKGVSQSLQARGQFIVYGPFKYGGDFTTPSNEQFDAWLKTRDARSGIRDIEELEKVAGTFGLSLVEDNAMPANNQLLVFLRD